MISIIDCLKVDPSKSSGITDTVAIYMNPPAVKGRTHAVAASPTK